MPSQILRLFQQLTGQRAPLANSDQIASTVEEALSKGIGCSQFNEALLLLGYDRVCADFFQFLVDGTLEYRSGAALTTLEQMQAGVDRFCKASLLFFGNVKYGFKYLSPDSERLTSWMSTLDPRGVAGFADRHEPLKDLQRIDPQDTYYLGYIVERQLREKLQKDPGDAEAQHAEARRRELVAAGKRNQEAYLASDHMDVYVATSMRERHEYLFVSEMSSRIFGDERLSKLKLRWFDPTQAYCDDRIDKGLAEALMLKRAKCTLYFVQEADTLGKDSELASTLAQGKPVIAFVPEVPDGYAEALLTKLPSIYPELDERTLILNQLQLFASATAWTDATVRRWIDDPSTFDRSAAVAMLQRAIRAHYDSRAGTIRDHHPLGIQVNLQTGVANGVLVVRTTDAAVEVIRRILTGALEFDLEWGKVDGDEEHCFLKERVSGCVFRVMTGNQMLTNSFWNFYLRPSS